MDSKSLTTQPKPGSGEGTSRNLFKRKNSGRQGRNEPNQDHGKEWRKTSEVNNKVLKKNIAANRLKTLQKILKETQKQKNESAASTTEASSSSKKVPASPRSSKRSCDLPTLPLDKTVISKISETSRNKPILREPPEPSDEMEWEEIEDQTPNTSSNNNNLESPVDIFAACEGQTMGDYLAYKALMLEDPFDPKYFFLVVDTNVLLSDLEYVEELQKTNFKKCGYPLICIPYIVLQELDRLKAKHQTHELQQRAKDAIYVINANLKKAKDGFIGQTVLEDANKLLEVETPDDRVLNYALQYQLKSLDVAILSNDVNLRNKAIVNKIKSFSAKELKELEDTLEFKNDS